MLGLASRKACTAADASADAPCPFSALASSLKKTMTIEDEFVRKSRKVSAGRLRDRWDEIACRKPVSVRRQAKGNLFSSGSTGEYHHLSI